MTHRLTKPQILAYSFGNFPSTAALVALGTWLMHLYAPSVDEAGAVIYVRPEVYGLILFLVMIPAAIADPLVGYISDRTQSKMGRRIPFIMWGLPLLLLGFVAVWFPPVHGTSWINMVFLAGTTLLFYLGFTVVVNPYFALMPEVVTEDGQRVSVSTWLAVFGSLGQVFAFMGFGLLIDKLHSGTLANIHIGDGYKVAGLLVGLLLILGFLPLIAMVHETPHSSQKEVPFTFWQACKETMKNPAFLPFVGPAALTGAAMALMQIAMVYIVKVVLGRSEELVGYLLLGMTAATMAFYPIASMLGHHRQKRQLFLLSLVLFVLILPLFVVLGWVSDPHMKQVFLWVLVVAIAFPVALFTVLQPAMLADIMDHDTGLTGYQREAMYNGMQGLIQKIGWGLAPLFQGLLFWGFGNTVERPWGILLAGVVSAILCLAGGIWFLRYPLKK